MSNHQSKSYTVQSESRTFKTKEGSMSSTINNQSDNCPIGDYTCNCDGDDICENQYEEDEVDDEINNTSHWVSPFSFLRSLVSKDKKRYKDGKFDLDLSYITPHIIAMGYPSSKMEGIYRNRLTDVVSFLNTRHPHHYKVYNLCIESSRHYDISLFENRVATYPFVDHNAPTLEQMLNCCRDIYAYLHEDPDNIVAVHCKAGKGRTGVMISCYLYYSHAFKSMDNALEYYASQRTYNNKGVTIPSQIRFVHYFGELITLWNCIEDIKHTYNKQKNVQDEDITSLHGSSYKEYPLIVPESYIRANITSIYHGPLYVLDTDILPFNSKLYISSFFVSFGEHSKSAFSMLKVKINSRDGKYFYNSKDYSENRYMDENNNWSVEFGNLLVEDEVLIQLFNGHQNIILQFWIHCAFMLNNSIRINKMDLDLISHDKHHKEYDKDLYVELKFNKYQ